MVASTERPVATRESATSLNRSIGRERTASSAGRKAFAMGLDVPELRRRADGLSKDYRELDARIQAKNWEIDLAE